MKPAAEEIAGEAPDPRLSLPIGVPLALRSDLDEMRADRDRLNKAVGAWTVEHGKQRDLAEKYRDQVRDTCRRAELAESERDELQKIARGYLDRTLKAEAGERNATDDAIAAKTRLVKLTEAARDVVRAWRRREDLHNTARALANVLNPDPVTAQRGVSGDW